VVRATDLVLQVIGLLDETGTPYMLVGSYSSNFYGRERGTNDADFVVQIENQQLSQIATRLGSDFRVDSQMSFETVTMTTRYIIHHPATEFKIELFLLSKDEHDQSRFQRRQHVMFEGRQVMLPTPEDVVVTKLRWSKGGKRSKDILDVAQVLAVQFGKLDLAYIRQWCDRHGTRDIFEQLQAEAARLNTPPLE
jgi:Nucleotidyl transferase of unknown function (DUF2204)